MTGIPKGGWTHIKHEGVTYQVPTVAMRERDAHTLTSAIDRILDAVTQRDHYEDDGIAIKSKYDCCGCSTYMKIVNDSIAAIKDVPVLFPKKSA